MCHPGGPAREMLNLRLDVWGISQSITFSASGCWMFRDVSWMKIDIRDDVANIDFQPYATSPASGMVDDWYWLSTIFVVNIDFHIPSRKLT